MHNFMIYSDEEITQFFKQSSPEQIQKTITHFSHAQIMQAILVLQEEINSNAPAKLMAIIEGLQSNACIETVGKSLSEEQFLHILIASKGSHLTRAKLSPLLVGVPHHIFYEALYLAAFEDIEPLKNEGLLVPLQHHLNLFVNECSDLLSHYLEEADRLYIEIRQMDITQLNFRQLHLVRIQIGQLAKRYEHTLLAIDKALAITWNTGRIDLIEKLTRLKEMAHHQFVQSIGVDKSQEHLSTGLFAALERFLSAVYGVRSEIESGIDSLKDEDLSLEGLTKFSIWYLEDYWELGLLPSVKHVKQLNLDKKKYGEIERMQHRQHLFDLVQKNLNHLALETVGDLKKAQIFSKMMLKEYIYQHQGILS